MTDVSDPTALSAQVAQLEERAGDLETLCGEVLATLHCNYQRGHLSYRADCGKGGVVTNELLGRMIDEWRARLGRLR